MHPAYSASMTDQPIIRFGVIADPQYADLEPNLSLDRYFRESLGKLEQALAHFEGEDLSFVVTLGDLIDRGWESFDPALGIYAKSRHECLFLPGNHDFLVGPERIADVPAKLGMPSLYHSFHRAGLRFLVIDGCEESLFATAADPARQEHARRRLLGLKAKGAINAMDWNAGISETQVAWIRAELEAAAAKDEKVVVLGHYPLFPPHDHNLWDGDRLAELMAASPQVIAYLSGHNHAGNLGQLGQAWFVNFHGMVDTQGQNAFAIVALYTDRLEITGYGRQPSHRLRLATA
jgi:3',5'-cyclic AMP phosphodiesterase CpdA